MDDLWIEVRACFQTDDGSLPSIVVENLSPSGLSAVYAMLRHRSDIVCCSSEFWNRTDAASALVDSVSDAASLVAKREADPFHLGIKGLIVGGVTLPLLGVFVFPDSIELDYRMGPEWGDSQIRGFFELLRNCCRLDLSAIVVPSNFEGPPYPERFQKTWLAYRNKDLTNG